MNKEMSLAQFAASLEDGMTIGIGGWGPRRKPMALVREILRSGVKDLTIVGYGGADMGMLCAAGKVRKLVYGFVSLDQIPIEPWFRKMREAGTVDVTELDEGLLLLGLQAQGHKLPFLPTRVGLGSAVMTYNPEFRTITSPYEDATTLLAMPAIKLDAALIHVSRADKLGNSLSFGPDPYFDGLMARAADRVYLSTDNFCDSIASERAEDMKANLFERYLVTGVVPTACGAHPTASYYDYGWDMKHLKTYAASATEEGGWQAYFDRFIAKGEADYLEAVGGVAAVRALPMPVI